LALGSSRSKSPPGYFKIAGHPIHGQMRVDHHVFGGATPVDSTETVEVTDRDFDVNRRRVDTHAEFLQACAELGVSDDLSPAAARGSRFYWCR
jgi:hypothetical protein